MAKANGSTRQIFACARCALELASLAGSILRGLRASCCTPVVQFSRRVPGLMAQVGSSGKQTAHVIICFDIFLFIELAPAKANAAPWMTMSSLC